MEDYDEGKNVVKVKLMVMEWTHWVSPVVKVTGDSGLSPFLLRFEPPTAA